uniref:BZIP domain-containing protein n=1 Tax=Leersia perrieri TaxID=77586 RepID=A0A0D9VD10_9ORYZ
MMAACAGEGDDEVAAGIICSLRGADLAGWTPPWWCGKQQVEEELIWPAVKRGKRSRRGSPAVAGKGRWGRGSPASPLDYSGGSRSGSGSASASTSGGEDGGAFCSPAATATTTMPKVGGMGRQHMTFPAAPSPLRPAGQRSRKKMRLPEVQQLVRSLAVENESLREEMRALQRACTALSKENDKLEIRFEISSSKNNASAKDLKGKQLDQQSDMQSAGGGFALPDLNLPVKDGADGSVH